MAEPSVRCLELLELWQWSDMLRRHRPDDYLHQATEALLRERPLPERPSEPRVRS